MHDIWNPWHGCTKCSEGCQNCYMYALDRKRGKDGSVVFRTKARFLYPLQQDRKGRYLIKSGETIRVCMTSDFFLEEADQWRDEAWDIIRMRRDVVFFLLTKRAQRLEICLPSDWCDGWDNILLNVTCENQKRADERIPTLLGTPAKHRGIMCAPLLGPIDITGYLQTGKIEQVLCGGENYDNPRPCHYEWAKSLYEQCVRYDVRFCFIETGSCFVKDGKQVYIPSKRRQSVLAHQLNLAHPGRPIDYTLIDEYGPVDELFLYRPHYGEACNECGSRPICNGCSNCRVCTVMESSPEPSDR